MVTKKFCINNSELKKLYNFMVKSKNDFTRSIIIKAEGVRVFIFHSDSYIFDGVNTRQVKKFKKLFSKGKVDAFCCCYPEETCIDMSLCFMGTLATGEISHSSEGNTVTFSCEESI